MKIYIQKFVIAHDRGGTLRKGEPLYVNINPQSPPTNTQRPVLIDGAHQSRDHMCP